MIQDLEADSGIAPVPPMDGDGHFLRVGFSIDMSVNLMNASHFDVWDASPGFSVWTETIPGAAKNWYFVMPNVVGHLRVPKPSRLLDMKNQLSLI